MCRDWTLHLTRDSAYPSFRVLTALRLFSLVCTLSQENLNENAIRLWRETLAGRRDNISPDNERRTRLTLDRVCSQLVKRGERGLETVKGMERNENGASGTVEKLWIEEILVARAVAECIAGGDVF